MIHGHAQDDKEKFGFTIEPFVSDGFMPRIDYRGDGRKGLTGAGVWPDIEKAKQIARDTASRLLHGAEITWEG